MIGGWEKENKEENKEDKEDNVDNVEGKCELREVLGGEGWRRCTCCRGGG